MREARARDERVRRGELAGATGEAVALAGDSDAAASRVAGLRVALAAAADRRDRLLAQGATVAAVVQLERYVRRLRHDLEAARRDLLRAEALHRGQLAAVDAARAQLVAARADREVIERHFARWRSERRKLADRRDD